MTRWGSTARTARRLLALQGCWTYERMHGIGMAWAAEPLLEDLRRLDPVRLAEARIRAAEPFNCHPYLAGLALGAQVRAEYDGVPGPQILRLRSALGGPLGALGDRLVWAGLVPLFIGVALAALAVGAGGWAACGVVAAAVGVRVAIGRWALASGLASGTGVVALLQRAWLAPAAERVGPWAGLAVGLALPLAGRHLLGPAPSLALAAAGGLAGLTFLLAWRFRARVTPVRLALALAAVVGLVHLGGP